jgi:uncharacterized glyoxalase superfamily protein PhnB
MSDGPRRPPGAAVATPYLCLRRCAEAIQWYAAVLDARVVGDPYVEGDGRVGHAVLDVGGHPVFVSDGFESAGVAPPDEDAATRSSSVYLYVADVDEVVARADSAGATVTRQPEDQPFGDRVAVLLDPFGARWMLATHLRGQEDDRGA